MPGKIELSQYMGIMAKCRAIGKGPHGLSCDPLSFMNVIFRTALFIITFNILPRLKDLN
jgi:hypothetical protein